MPGLGPGKSLALLAYLSVRGPARRDELISLLWGEIPEDKARNAFRQSLHRLRAVLGDEVLPQDREQVAIAGNGLQSDHQLFMEGMAARRWAAAVEAYGGEFLEGLEIGEPAFDRWADAERVRLRARFEEALLAAGQDAVAAGRIDDAVRYAQRLTATAPFDERAAIFEANALVTAGRPNQAAAALQHFVERLNEELDLPTPPAVRALLERLERRGVRDASTPPSAGRVVAGFVGRSAELSRMLALVSALRAERGATLLVDGDAGIGKSRLLDEFSDRARNLGGVSILRGREAGLGGGIPYAAIADALRPIVRAPGIAGASKHLLAEAARLLPELRDNFELPAVATIEDETGRLRFFEGIAALVDAAAYERPVVVIIDDAQHASPSTIDLLTYLSRRLHQSPVLMVVAFRSDRGATGMAERLRELASAGEPDATLSLGPFPREEAEQLARDLLRNNGAVSDAALERILRAAGGRPFAIAELARQASAGELPSEAPSTLHDALFARFQTASPSQRRIFFAASLFERNASLRLLAAAAHLPEATAFEAVERLVRMGLLRIVDQGYVVAHDSTLGFLVEASGLAGRALLAGWAADALIGESDCSASELASLYAMAGRGPEAFHSARAAAFDAASVGAATEAIRLLGVALTFAPNDAARREIDSLLTAFGRTRLSLPAPVSAEKPTIAEPAVEDVRRPTPESAPVETAPPIRRSRWNSGTSRQWAVSILISLLIVVAGFGASRAIAARGTTISMPDTLVLNERDERGVNAVRFVVDASKDNPAAPVAAADGLGPAWIDSIKPPWSGPRVSPNRRWVALQRVTPHGADLFAVSADRRDTVAVGRDGDYAPLAWSPDSRALVVTRSRTLRDGSFDSDLFVAWLAAPGTHLPIDTTSSRSIAEAAWSPDGVHIAWVARSGSTRQRDIFVARADGSEARNVSANPADDYDIAWSPDGGLLAFMSTREGGTRLFVYDFDAKRLWPISDQSNEAHPIFSPDGRMVAFESTRDGDLGVYARPALGGTVRRVTPAGRQFSIAAWRGAPAAFVDRVRILAPPSLVVGDTTRLSTLVVTSANQSENVDELRWSLPDGSVLSPETGASPDSSAIPVVAHAVGSARVIASIPGWRADTLVVTVNTNQSVHVDDDFSGRTLDSRWLPLGSPAPYVGRSSSNSPGVFPNGDLEWESGVLMRSSVELRPGLHLRAKIHAPFGGRSSPATLAIGFVSSTAESAIDHLAPRFTAIVSLQWDGASGNLLYAVGQQVSTDAAPQPVEAGNTIEISIGQDRSVIFSVDGNVRRRSSLNYLGDVRGTPVQVWIGGRATGPNVAVSGFSLDVPGRAR